MLKLRPSSWVMLPALLFAFIPSQAQADPLPGLNAVYYTIDEVPPIQSDDEYIQCGMEIENNINRSYDGEPIESCPDDLFMVHLTGFITIPEHDTIEFFLASDDGGEATIGNNTWGSWTDQGCSAWMSGNLNLEAGSQPIEVWMYEHGGGACLMLAWKIDDNEWEIVPEWAFTTESIPQMTTTTTTAPLTTVPVTVTTSTTVPETTTTSTTTTTTTSTTTTTTIVVPTQTTVSPPDTLPFVPEAPQTVPEPSTTILIPIVEESTTTSLLEIESTTTTPVYPSTTELPTTTEPTVVDTTSTTEVELLSSSTTVSDITSEIVEDEPISATKALEIIGSNDFNNISVEQITEVFQNIDISSFTEEQQDELVSVLNEASDMIKEAFEEEINVFAEGLDDYIPSGSNVPVGTRRTLIAVTAVTAMATAPKRRIN